MCHIILYTVTFVFFFPLILCFITEIMNEAIKETTRKNAWRVLVVDHLAMRMISACCKMHDITEEGITS